MTVWTVANQKGGVGKTTTALALAGLAAQSDERVLLVDLDPHASLTTFFRLDPDALEYSVHTMFEQRQHLNELAVRRCIYGTTENNLSILPASAALISIDRQPVGHDGMGMVLQQALDHIKQFFDLIIIDGPPMAGVLLVNGLLASERIIIPVQTEFLALQGLARMMRTLSLLRSSTGRESPDELFVATNLIVPTLFDRRTQASQHALQTLRDQYHQQVWSNQVTLDTKLRDAMETGRLPHRLTEESSGVAAYRMLFADLLRCPDEIDVNGPSMKVGSSNRLENQQGSAGL